jgi:hypothetical protein
LEILSGDRVQWFRAEAEMQRWQEQGKQKLAELLRTSRWSALAQLYLLVICLALGPPLMNIHFHCLIKSWVCVP